MTSRAKSSCRGVIIEEEGEGEAGEAGDAGEGEGEGEGAGVTAKTMPFEVEVARGGVVGAAAAVVVRARGAMGPAISRGKERRWKADEGK